MLFKLPHELHNVPQPLNPLTDGAQEHVREWTRSLGLEGNEHASHQLDIYVPGPYGGYMWPFANRNDLYILADLTGWFSCQDDLADEDLTGDPDALERALRHAYAAAFKGEEPTTPLAAGLVDIITRASAEMPPQWVERTGETYANYLMPCMAAAMYRKDGTHPATDSYPFLWRNAGGFQVCVEFTYFATRVHLPSGVYYSVPWLEIVTLSLNILKATNDLLSFGTMENPDEDVFNLVTHYRRAQGMSPEDAAEAVSTDLSRWVREFRSREASIWAELRHRKWPAKVCDQASKVAVALREQWCGNVGWHLAVPRYKEDRFRP